MPRPDQKNKATNKKIHEYRGQILNWYDKHQRELPWRHVGAGCPDPYKVWLSEIMLQQTTVQAVKSYYIKFLERWPTVQALAAADREDIMAEWAGLGYYSRARNLHACANIITNDYKGVFPSNQKELQRLPGVGDYTSAAIRTIAFNKPATVLDGNIERIMARFYAITEPLPKSKHILKGRASHFFSEQCSRPGDLAQALMDIGATICTPKSSKCPLCPIQKGCEAHKQGIAETLPKKLKKAPKPQKEGYVYWITNSKAQILLHKRPENGLLAGTIGLPTSEWSEKPPKHMDFIGKSEVINKNLHIKHSFTHFDLKLHLYTANVAKTLSRTNGYIWKDLEKIQKNDFPTVFRKVLNLCFE